MRVVVSVAGEDKFSIFYSIGQSIKGVTKKGKEFFKLDTSHAEAISSLHVQAQNLWSAGEYILNCYMSAENQIKDKFYFICEDKINDMVLAPVGGQMVLNAVLACQDKQIRVLKDDGKEVLYSQPFESACMTLSLSAALSERKCPIVGYGLSSGEIGVIELMRSQPNLLWSLDPSQIQKNAPARIVKVCQLDKKNLMNTGAADSESVFDFIVARDNGVIEIYCFQVGNPFPNICFETQIQQTITSIDVGHVTMVNSKDIIVSCYDGKVLCLVDSKKFKKQGIMANEDHEEINNQKQQDATKHKKIKEMEAEIAALEKQMLKLMSENAELETQINVKSQSQGVGSEGTTEIKQFRVSHKMNLIAEEGAYMLIIDS